MRFIIFLLISKIRIKNVRYREKEKIPFSYILNILYNYYYTSIPNKNIIYSTYYCTLAKGKYIKNIFKIHT